MRKVVAGCTDLKATEALARKLETDAFNRCKGVIDERAERLRTVRPRRLWRKTPTAG